MFQKGLQRMCLHNFNAGILPCSTGIRGLTHPTALRRSLATAAASSSAAPAVSLESIKAGLLLARNPIVTPDLTPLEQAYYNYQEELERRLMWTFPHYYYFKKGSLAERRFFKAQRGPVSKQPGVFYPKGIPDIVHNRERRSKQEVIIPKDEYEESSMSDISRPVVPNSRTTEADSKSDLKSLERKLPRTLYLLVEDGKLGWKLPSFNTTEGTPLHRSAEDGLRQLGGEEINTWTVARSPAALLKFNGSKISTSAEQDTTREFIIKSNILSGSFKPTGIEYAWLTREEIESKVSGEYFEATEFLFSRV